MIFSPTIYPNSTGLSEYSVRLVKDQLIKWAADRKWENLDEWYLTLPSVALNINTRYIPSLGFAPLIPFLGFKPQKRVVEDALYPAPAPADYQNPRLYEVVGLRIKDLEIRRDSITARTAEKADIKY